MFAVKKAALGITLILVFAAMCVDNPGSSPRHGNSSGPDVLIGNYNPQFLQHSSAEDPLFILMQDQLIGEIPFILETQLGANTTSLDVFNQGYGLGDVRENHAALLKGTLIRKEISVATYSGESPGKPDVEGMRRVNVTYFNASSMESVTLYALDMPLEEILAYFNGEDAEMTLTLRNPLDRELTPQILFLKGWSEVVLFNESISILPEETKKIMLPALTRDPDDAPASFRLRIRSYAASGKALDQEGLRSPILSVDNYRISLLEELNEGDMWLAGGYGTQETLLLGAALDDVTQKNKELIFELYDNLCKKNNLENQYEHLRYKNLGSRVDLRTCLLSTPYAKTCVEKVTSADNRFYLRIVAENSGRTASPPLFFNFTWLGNVTLEKLSVYDPILREYVEADPGNGFIVYPVMNPDAAFEYDSYDGGIYTPRYAVFLLELSAPEGRNEFEFTLEDNVIRRSFELKNFMGRNQLY